VVVVDVIVDVEAGRVIRKVDVMVVDVFTVVRPDWLVHGAVSHGTLDVVTEALPPNMAMDAARAMSNMATTAATRAAGSLFTRSRSRSTD